MNGNEKKNNRKVNKKKENHGLKGKKIINENEIKKKVNGKASKNE